MIVPAHLLRSFHFCHAVSYAVHVPCLDSFIIIDKLKSPVFVFIVYAAKYAASFSVDMIIHNLKYTRVSLYIRFCLLSFCVSFVSTYRNNCLTHNMTVCGDDILMQGLPLQIPLAHSFS